MKTILLSVSLLVAGITNAQLVIDDFTTGTIEKRIFSNAIKNRQVETGSGIVKGNRLLYAKIRQNPNNHGMQLSIKNGLLTMSYGYDTRGTTFVNYGVDKQGKNKQMNLNLKDYKVLKVEFEAKSTINGINVNLFTGNRYAAYGKHVPAREGKMVFEIPLKDFKPTHKDFTFADIDYMRFQFDSRSKTGCNMAINKIWFE